MQGHYIRNLNIRYTDPIEKVIEKQQLPRKFTQTNRILYDDSDYKKKPLITIVRPSSSKPLAPTTQTNCFTRFFSCFTVELCSQCRAHLCEQCKNSKFLKLSICDHCEKELCPGCRRNVEGKKVKLRNYRIKLKNVKELHFHDCDCKDCETDRQRHH